MLGNALKNGLDLTSAPFRRNFLPIDDIWLALQECIDLFSCDLSLLLQVRLAPDQENLCVRVALSLGLKNPFLQMVERFTVVDGVAQDNGVACSVENFANRAEAFLPSCIPDFHLGELKRFLVIVLVFCLLSYFVENNVKIQTDCRIVILIKCIFCYAR